MVSILSGQKENVQMNCSSLKSQFLVRELCACTSLGREIIQGSRYKLSIKNFPRPDYIYNVSLDLQSNPCQIFLQDYGLIGKAGDRKITLNNGGNTGRPTIEINRLKNFKNHKGIITDKITYDPFLD